MMTPTQKWMSFFVGGILVCGLYIVFLVKETHVVFVSEEYFASSTEEAHTEQETQGNNLEKEKSIFLLSPQSGELMRTSFQLFGIARAFENTIEVEMRKKESGELLYKNSFIVNADDPSHFGEFVISLGSRDYCDGKTEIQAIAFVESPKDGSRMDEDSVNFFCGEGGLRQVDIFFENAKEEGEISCDRVFRVKRGVEATPKILETTLKELLNGPQEKEKLSGFVSSIPNGVSLRSVALKGATAIINVSSDMSQYGGGSCRVGLIRKELEETAKQFGTVSDVELKVEGKTEGILEP